MNKQISGILMLIAFLVFFSACSKNDEVNPFNGRTNAIFNPSVPYETLTDLDGNMYKTVIIGTQTWMAENLRTSKYNDGTMLLNIADAHEWIYTRAGAYSNYDNTSDIDTIATFGRLYNWHAVKTNKLAPIGWHIPTDAEWTTLIDYLGEASVAGIKLKETGLRHWIYLGTMLGTTNETGFSALPGGSRYSLSEGIGFVGYWWSATEYNFSDAWIRFMTYSGSSVYRAKESKFAGFSIRCVKD